VDTRSDQTHLYKEEATSTYSVSKQESKSYEISHILQQSYSVIFKK